MKYEKRGGCMADSRAIGVFDSGLGGLTVARVDLKMPENHYIDQYYVIEDLAAKGGPRQS